MLHGLRRERCCCHYRHCSRLSWLPSTCACQGVMGASYSLGCVCMVAASGRPTLGRSLARSLAVECVTNLRFSRQTHFKVGETLNSSLILAEWAYTVCTYYCWFSGINNSECCSCSFSGTTTTSTSPEVCLILDLATEITSGLVLSAYLGVCVVRL